MEEESDLLDARETRLTPFRELAFLKDFAASFHPLADRGNRDLQASLERLAGSLSGLKPSAEVEIVIATEDERNYWVVDIEPRASQLRTGRSNDPDLEIVLQEATWWEIAEGDLSPLEAFTRGSIFVRGDLDVARRLCQQLAR